MARHTSARARKAARKTRQAQATPEAQTALVALKVGDHQFPAFTAIDAAFGANERDYPDYGSIPAEHRHGSKFGRVFSGLFYSGGTLADHGLKLRAGVDRASFYTTLRALMCSWAPKHEVKEATVAWFLAEHTEAA